MSLPNLASLKPTYQTTLPTTGENVKYNPYTREDEKSLLVSLQETDYVNAILTIENIITQCCDNPLTTVVDFVYLMTHVKAKSHGESHAFLVNCDCGKENIEVKVDNILDHLKIKNSNKLKDTYKINDDITLRLCPTKINLLKSLKYNDPTIEDQVEQIYLVIANSVEYVKHKTSVIRDFTDRELIENIIKHLTSKQIEEINEKIGNLVSIYYEVKYICSDCDCEKTRTIDDFLSFG